MQIRDPHMPPESEPDGDAPASGAAMGGDTPAGGWWRVTPALPALKLAGAAAFALLAVAFGSDPVRLVLAGAAALVLVGWAIRDLIAPVRLAADRDGVTMVVGFAGRRHLPWSQVERVRVDNRPRFGLRTETLEIDTGETLHLFSSYDLGAPPREVADRLAALRAAS